MCSLDPCIFEQTLVFGGIRFEVESAAVLLFSEDTSTEFTGVNNLVRRASKLAKQPDDNRWGDFNL